MLTLRSQFQEIIRKQSRIFHSHFCHPIWTNTNRSTITEKRSSQIMVASDPRCVFCLTKPLTLIWIDWYTTIFVPLHCIDSCSLKTPVFHLLRASSSSTQCAPDAIDPSGRTRDPLDLSSLNIFIDPSNSVRAGPELRFANSVVAIWLCNSSIHYIYRLHSAQTVPSGPHQYSAARNSSSYPNTRPLGSVVMQIDAKPMQWVDARKRA